MLRVGLHENISILFLLAIKTAGSAQKLRVGRVSGNTAIFVYPLYNGSTVTYGPVLFVSFITVYAFYVGIHTYI